MKTRDEYEIEEITRYFEEIKDNKPYSASEEAVLSKRIQEGDIESRDKLVKANLRFVVSIAKAYRKSGVSFQDLISAGNMGLIKAAEKFDWRKGVKFISYAVWWIRQSIQECIQDFTGNGADEYSIEESNIDGEHDELPVQTFDSINAEFEDEICDRKSRQRAVDDLFSVLKEREAKILSLYFGLYGNEEMTLDEIGKEMNLTMERVRQIRDMAMVKVKCAAVMSTEFKTYNELK